MDTFVVWHDLDLHHGVLELAETLTAPGPSLDLHVVTDPENGHTAAWWADDEGTWLRIADVGTA
jgi:hypothetical protein